MLKDFGKEKFDIIIQGGQSNSDGTGHGKVANPYCVNDNVWFLNQDFTISMAHERVAGNHMRSDFSLEFARLYLGDGLLKNGRKLLIVRSAVGGTGFSDKRWGPKDDLFLQMMEMIKTAISLNNENRLVGFIWHQGETDASFQASYETHYNNLSKLVEIVRNSFNCPDLPFIAGDFVQLWNKTNPTIVVPIIDAMRAVCKDIGSAAFVETTGLNSNFEEYGLEEAGDKDDVHFSRAALYLLGARYYEAYKKIIS